MSSLRKRFGDWLEWFWIRHGLLFPSTKREKEFFDYQIQSTRFSRWLLSFVAVACCIQVVATIVLVSIETASTLDEAHIVQRALPVSEGVSRVVALWVLSCTGMVFMLLIAAGVWLPTRRRKLWNTAAWTLGVWECVFLLIVVLQLCGVPITGIGPVYPFASALLVPSFSKLGAALGFGSSLSASSSSLLLPLQLLGLGHSAFDSRQGCSHNITDNILVVNDTCEFNLTTVSSVMMYSGFTNGSASVLSMFALPWIGVVVAGVTNMVFQARHMAWLAPILLLCMVLTAGGIVMPTMNFNTNNTVTTFTRCDPTFAVIFWSMISSSLSLAGLTAIVVINVSYVHERNVREMYFWADFTRVRRDQLSTRRDPFTTPHLSQWLRRHTSRAVRVRLSNSSSGEDADELRRRTSSVPMSVGTPGSGWGTSVVNDWEIDAADIKLVRKRASGSAGTVWYAEYRGTPVAAKVMKCVCVCLCVCVLTCVCVCLRARCA